MSCLLTSGFDFSDTCKGTGGIKRILITNKSNVASFTEGTVGTPAVNTGEITGITMESLKVWYEFVPYKWTGSYKDEESSANAATIYTCAIEMNLPKNSVALRNQILILGQGVFYCIVEDQNGNYFLLGRINGLDMTTGTGGSGVAGTDANGWIVTMTGAEPQPAYGVDPDIIAALLV